MNTLEELHAFAPHQFQSNKNIPTRDEEARDDRRQKADDRDRRHFVMKACREATLFIAA
jgi:hypothetical protein